MTQLCRKKIKQDFKMLVHTSITLSFIILVQSFSGLILAQESSDSGVYQTSTIPTLQHTIVKQAKSLMNDYSISYTYGGSNVQEQHHCKNCTLCLEDKKPRPRQRLTTCEICTKCSLDCSHFVQLVFENSGIEFDYLTSIDMKELSSVRLAKNFQLLEIPLNKGLQAGDLLVYRGHVAILERALGPKKGDIIHATGGKDIRKPGQGIQRESNVGLSQFRGPLLRVLRHKRLEHPDTAIRSSAVGHHSSINRLRPVPQRAPGKSD